MKKPNRHLLASIIDKIFIDKDKNISINLRIKNPSIFLDTKQCVFKNS